MDTKGGMNMLETKTGIIKGIRSGKTYGFIKQDDGGEDLFFHKLGVISPSFEELREGMPVEYMVADTPKGGRAIGVVAV